MSEFEDIPDEWFESINHQLLEIKTKQQAEEYVKSILDISSETEILQYARVYFTTSQSINRSHKRERGGSKYLKCDDSEDPRIYKLLAALDTIHDVCKITERDTWKYGVDIEQVLKESGVTEIPKGMTEEMMMDEQKAVDFMANEKTLTFNGDILSNPLYDNGINTFDVTRYKRLSSYLNKLDTPQQQDKRNRHLCIIAETEMNKKVSAKQILRLLQNIKMCFGTVCEFLMDTEHKVTKIFHALSLLNEAWYNVFTDKSITFSEFIHAMKKITISKSQWNTFITDAKMFDGMPHQPGIQYDSRPTGWIYRHDVSFFNICLKGIDNNYRLCFATSDGKEECMDRSDAEIQHTTNMLFYKTNNLPKAISYKRAGDWAQVEHCKRYDKIFVTFDRLAALYAYYRKTKFIFIRCIWRKNENFWVQFAFTISK
jgi:hypothetical protein